MFNFSDIDPAEEDKTSGLDEPTIYTNLFVAHSTIEGNTSLRWKDTGSPFIEGHCRAMRYPWKDNTIFDILNKTATERLHCGPKEEVAISSDFVVMGVISECIMKYPMSIVCLKPEERERKINSM